MKPETASILRRFVIAFIAAMVVQGAFILLVHRIAPPNVASVFSSSTCIVTFVAMTYAMWPTLRRREWIAKGRCRQCGFDIRFSKNKCPECGASIGDSEKSPS
jgi:hypothetical protein